MKPDLAESPLPEVGFLRSLPPLWRLLPCEAISQASAYDESVFVSAVQREQQQQLVARTFALMRLERAALERIMALR